MLIHILSLLSTSQFLLAFQIDLINWRYLPTELWRKENTPRKFSSSKWTLNKSKTDKVLDREVSFDNIRDRAFDNSNAFGKVFRGESISGNVLKRGVLPDHTFMTEIIPEIFWNKNLLPVINTDISPESAFDGGDLLDNLYVLQVLPKKAFKQRDFNGFSQQGENMPLYGLIGAGSTDVSIDTTAKKHTGKSVVKRNNCGAIMIRCRKQKPLAPWLQDACRQCGLI